MTERSSQTRRPHGALSHPGDPHQTLDAPRQRLLDACRFVLVSPSLPANVGSAVRALTTMGVADLMVAAPRDEAFREDAGALARAGGARARVASVQSRESLDAALADCELAVAVSAGGRAFGPAPEFPGPLCRSVLAALAAGSVRRVAFVFGTERTGLSTQEMARCQRWLAIPADAAYSSLNLAQAVQIVAFSLRQAVLEAGNVPVDGGATGHAQGAWVETAEPLASLAAVEGLYAHLERSLIALGTLDPSRPRRLMPRLRHLLGRTQLTAPEVDLLRGICRDIGRMAESGARGGKDAPS